MTSQKKSQNCILKWCPVVFWCIWHTGVTENARVENAILAKNARVENSGVAWLYGQLNLRLYRQTALSYFMENVLRRLTE